MVKLSSKSEIRDHFLNLRQNSLDSLDDDNILLAEQVINYFIDLKSRINIGIYSPFKTELDISLITEYLMENHSVSLPEIIDEEKMEFIDCETNSAVIPEILIIPSITCDKQLNRIGYGKGYYDKYLAKNMHIYKIAILPAKLVYNGQIPAERHDIKMDLLITEKEIYQGTQH